MQIISWMDDQTGRDQTLAIDYLKRHIRTWPEKQPRPMPVPFRMAVRSWAKPMSNTARYPWSWTPCKGPLAELARSGRTPRMANPWSFGPWIGKTLSRDWGLNDYTHYRGSLRSFEDRKERIDEVLDLLELLAEGISWGLKHNVPNPWLHVSGHSVVWHTNLETEHIVASCQDGWIRWGRMSRLTKTVARLASTRPTLTLPEGHPAWDALPKDAEVEGFAVHLGPWVRGW